MTDASVNQSAGGLRLSRRTQLPHLRAAPELDRDLPTHRRHGRTGPQTATRSDERRVTVRTVLTAADRKSTRLNSSHPSISYAVFCLKKKKKQTPQTHIDNRTRTHRYPPTRQCTTHQ